eukprot:TCALIF_09840-PA protein Name:"Protein of unknown function" AED:0.28 eAED:0.28 QI:215/0.2/0.83/1/0.8/0.83/6/0/129
MEKNGFCMGFGNRNGTCYTQGECEARGGAIGDCATDIFTITAPGNFAPPVICGFNTGQHTLTFPPRQQLWTLQIPNAQSNVETNADDTFVIGTIGSDVNLSDRICGRFFSSALDDAERQLSRSVCSKYK